LRLGIAPEDVIGLLERIGGDTAGALSIGNQGSGGTPGHVIIPDEAALERIINELPAKPFLVGENGVSMSLSGVQDKCPVTIVDGHLAIPTNGTPSTHILKPDATNRLFGSVQNEALCLVLANRCAVPAANVTSGRAGSRTYLLITRYDRTQRSDKRWIRIHQEDFCQALGKPPSAKYEHNQSGIKGPRLVDMLKLADTHMTAADKLRLLDAVIYNVLICNTDSHAKNYSIILSGRGATLAPLYDLMCAACWNVTRNLPQSIAGKDRGDHICGRHWQRMADECGFNRTAILRRVEHLANTVLRELGPAVAEVEAMPAGGHGMISEFQGAIMARCRTVRSNLRNVAPESEALAGL
jgi:serine/threonine-protein kinase HipA